MLRKERRDAVAERILKQKELAAVRRFVFNTHQAVVAVEETGTCRPRRDGSGRKSCRFPFFYPPSSMVTWTLS